MAGAVSWSSIYEHLRSIYQLLSIYEHLPSLYEHLPELYRRERYLRTQHLRYLRTSIYGPTGRSRGLYLHMSGAVSRDL